MQTIAVYASVNEARSNFFDFLFLHRKVVRCFWQSLSTKLAKTTKLPVSLIRPIIFCNLAPD